MDHRPPHTFATSRGYYAKCPDCGEQVVEDWDRPSSERSMEVGEAHKARAVEALKARHAAKLEGQF